MKNSLVISPRLFAIEKKNYTDWEFAFVRELAQNSRDANSSNFNITIKKVDKEENKCLVVFADDGNGMSLEVLNNVFLSLGETSKHTNDSLGGFGKARNLTAFSADYYKITSDSYSCYGVGAQYEIKKSPTIKGCVFEAQIECPADRLIEKTKRFFSLSNIPVSVILNGEKLNMGYRLGAFCRELSCGRIYANKSNNEIKNKVIVRVNGLVTFTHYTAANAGVTIEIYSHKSREILSATRDNLNHQYTKEVDEFLGELSADTTSALKDRSRRFVKFINKSKGFLSRAKRNTNQIASVTESNSTNTVIKQVLNTNITNTNTQLFERSLEQTNRIDFSTTKVCPILESMIIYADTNNENIKKVIKFYDPTQNNGSIGVDRHKFLKQWKSICDIVVEELSNLTNSDYMWAVGFCFDDDAVAMHQKTEGISYIMINPVTNDGKMKYSINSKKDFAKMTVSAIHEFCHAAGYQLHNQDFVICYDNLLERVIPRLRDIFHAAAAAKN